MRTCIFRILCTGFLLLVFFTTMGTFSVRADGPIVTGTIIAGLLTETSPAAEAFTGSPGSTADYTIPIAVSDLTGSASGWNLTITSTTFTTALGGHTLPTNASIIASVTAVCTVTGTCSQGTLTNTVGTLPGVPAGTTPPTPVKFFGTSAGTGTGVYTVTPSITVSIPATTTLGAYLSTVTLAVASGP